MTQQPDSRRWWALTALVLTSLAVGFDVTILNLALPSMAEDLRADNAHCSGSSPSTRWCSPPA
ncbi:hypothetical protein GCM10022224_088180 [Nonomuraea antimicrobica]|uniref:Major facilitator superfamily (MFS) profile domain-containing protein n=1 Tax=Nonomuraea antimicrobica TaxID=561173 RepID=A0ABP7DWN0_9ACTN